MKFLKVLKYAGLLLLGGGLTVGIISAVIGVGCWVNHIAFGEQIVQWFGAIGKTVVDASEEVVKTGLMIM